MKIQLYLTTYMTILMNKQKPGISGAVQSSSQLQLSINAPPCSIKNSLKERAAGDNFF